MANYPIRFDRGLGVRHARKTQPEFLELQNVRLDRTNVVAKRPGGTAISLSRSGDPNDLISQDAIRALYHREDEMLLETANELYSRRECAGAGSQSPGTATPQEILDAFAAFDQKYDDTYDIALPQVPLGNTAAALDRLDRFADTFQPYALSSLGPVVSVTVLLVRSAGSLKITWTGDDTGEIPISSDAELMVQTGGNALVLATAVDDPSNPGYTRVRTYDVYVDNLAPAGQKVKADVKATYSRVIGKSTGAAWDMNPDGFVAYVRQAAFLPNDLIISTSTGLDFTMTAGDKAKVLDTSTNSYKCATDGSQVPQGPWLALVPEQTVAANEKNLYVWDLPAVSGAAPTAATFDSVTLALGGVIAMASDGAAGIVAVRDAMGGTLADFSFTSEGSFLKWNGPAAGLIAHYERVAGSGAGSVSYKTILDGVDMLPVTLATATFHQWLQGPSSLIAGLLMLGTNVGWIYAQDPRGIKPTLQQVTNTSYAGVLMASPTRFGVLVRSTTQHVLWYSSDSLVWAGASIDAIGAAMQASQTSGEAVAGALRDNGPDLEVRGVQYVAADFTMRGYTYNVTTAAIANQTVNQLSQYPAGIEMALIQAGAWPRVIIALQGTDGLNQAAYELDGTLWVRVSPALVVLPGGDWGQRGPWTRSRVRAPLAKDYGADTVNETGAARVISAHDPDKTCTIQMVEVNGQGLRVLVYSDHTEADVLVDLLGTDPHVARHSDKDVLLSYVDAANALQYQAWRTGLDFVFGAAGLILDAGHVYDQDSAVYENDSYSAWIGRTAAATVFLRVIPDIDPAVSQNISPAAWSSVDAVSIYAVANQAEPAVVVAMLGVKGDEIIIRVAQYDISGGVILVWAEDHATGLMTAGGEPNHTPIAISVGALESVYNQKAQVWIEVATPEPEHRVIAFSAEKTVGYQEIRTWRRAAIYSSMRELFHPYEPMLVGSLSAVEAAQDRARRAGYFLVDAETGEVVGRIATGKAEDLTARLLQRNQVTNLNSDGMDLVMGLRKYSGALVPTEAAFARWDFAQMPNRPGVLAGVLVSAHGGYPRAYDSAAIFEHDWHELAQFGAVTEFMSGTGAIATGDYGVAVTYEDVDAFGQLYQCAPDFDRIVVTGGNDTIRLQVRPLVFSERTNARIVVWRTLNAGTDYYQAHETSAFANSDYIQIDLIAADSTLLTNRILDQIDGGIVQSTQAQISDWVAVADGRFWGPDPARLSLVRFTIPQSEGFAPHWSLAQGVESSSSRAVTAMAELDGRLIFWTALGIAYTGTGGPDATGQGLYAVPSMTPSEIGALDIHTVEILPPFGLCFGSASGPRLLSRAIQVEDMSDAVARLFSGSDYVITSEWVPKDGTLRMSTRDGRALRFHPETGRWGEDTGRAALDTSVSQSGVYAALLRDATVLIEDDEDQYTDGSIAYEQRLRSQWVRTSASPVHTSEKIGRVVAFGEWEGAHALLFELYEDYGTTPRTFTMEEARIQALIDAGEPYVIEVVGDSQNAHSFSVAISDGGVAGPSFELEGIDVTVEPNGTNKPHSFAADHAAKAD